MATVNSLICFGGLNGKTVTFTDAGDVVNLTANGVRPGQACFFQNTGGAVPIGLSADTLYYGKPGADANKFLLYPTPADAIAGTNQVTFTGTGSGTTVVKSGTIFGPVDLSRYDNTRVYDGLVSWNTGRSGADKFDVEVAEIDDAFTEAISSQLLITIPSAQNIITSRRNGIRVKGWHNANHPESSLATLTLAAGYVLYASGGVGGAAMIKLARYRDTIDGITIMNTSGGSVGYGVDLDVLCTLRNSFVYCTRSLATGVNLRSAFAKAENNIFNGWNTGAAAGSSQSGLVFQNNFITKCNSGFSAASTVKGFWYNNISVGNTTNWGTQPTSLEGASNNAGLAGEAWMTAGGSRITIGTSNFADWDGNNFYPASSSSPQVKTGVMPYGYVTDDIADRFRPEYMGGAATTIDLGPFEFNQGFGPWPATATINITNVVSGSRILITKASDGSVLYNDTPGTSLSFSTTFIGDFNVVVRKASASPYYREFQASGTTVADQTTSIKCLQQLDE